MNAPIISPGEVLRDKIKALGITQEKFALGTGIHFVTLNRLIKGHEPITPRYALILAKAFSLKPQYWLYLGADYDLARFLANPDYSKGRTKKFKLTLKEAVEQARAFD